MISALGINFYISLVRNWTIAINTIVKCFLVLFLSRWWFSCLHFLKGRISRLSLTITRHAGPRLTLTRKFLHMNEFLVVLKERGFVSILTCPIGDVGPGVWLDVQQVDVRSSQLNVLTWQWVVWGGVEVTLMMTITEVMTVTVHNICYLPLFVLTVANTNTACRYKDIKLELDLYFVINGQ